MTYLEKHQTYTIVLLQNDELFKYLEIAFTLDSDQNYQFKSILSVAQLRSRILSTSPFKYYNSKLYLFTHLNLTIYYPFPSTSLFPKQYKVLHRDHILAAISSTGYNRTWTSTLSLAFHKYSDLQLKNIQIEAIVRKIKQK